MKTFAFVMMAGLVGTGSAHAAAKAAKPVLTTKTYTTAAAAAAGEGARRFDANQNVRQSYGMKLGAKDLDEKQLSNTKSGLSRFRLSGFDMGDGGEATTVVDAKKVGPNKYKAVRNTLASAIRWIFP